MPAPEGLRERGSALWSALGCELDTAAGAVALEACRLADRLDELDRVIAGKGVLNLMSFRLDLDLEDEVGDRQVNVRVEFSNVLAEARQQAVALRQLLTTLGIDRKGSAKPEEEASPLAQILALVQPASNASGGSA